MQPIDKRGWLVVYLVAIGLATLLMVASLVFSELGPPEPYELTATVITDYNLSVEATYRAQATETALVMPITATATFAP